MTARRVFSFPCRAAALTVAVVFWMCALAGASAPGSCPDGVSRIVVDTGAGELFLCQRGEVFRSYRVALGRKGVGKNRQGDEKTPLGTYTLGEPRLSENYFAFIPINYPTEEQREQGYTGGAIGIHGPWQDQSVFEPVASLDWTNGCIALASNLEIAEIVIWMKKRGVHRIEIR
jgi:murein L,D-transpeptidase YafK